MTVATDFSGSCVRFYRLALKSNDHSIRSHLIWILWNTGNKAFFRSTSMPMFNCHTTNRMAELLDIADILLLVDS